MPPPTTLLLNIDLSARRGVIFLAVDLVCRRRLAIGWRWVRCDTMAAECRIWLGSCVTLEEEDPTGDRIDVYVRCDAGV